VSSVTGPTSALGSLQVALPPDQIPAGYVELGDAANLVHLAFGTTTNR
jgi:hypothetical protein